MIRSALMALVLLASPAIAQDFTASARVLGPDSAMTDRWGKVSLILRLSQIVPYGVFTLDEPNRIILEFEEVDWTNLPLDFDQTDLADVSFGRFRPGASRMVVAVDSPMAVETVEAAVDEASGEATLTLQLTPVTQETFTANTRPPPTDEWAHLTASLPPAPEDDGGPLIVVIDPGHGGIDPGAERGGVKEADLMLRLSIEVAEALNRSGGVRAVLTRETDIFVPLTKRLTIARAAGADLLISLHADALEVDDARGASVYTMNAEGEDKAAARMAERHERGDLIAGLDLTGQDDRVATVLMDLARAETAPLGQRFADQLVQAMSQTGQRLNSRPRREGRFAVLNAADFPSVLVEVGFLSNTRDREALLTAQGRQPTVDALVQAVGLWARDRAAQSSLVRQ